MPKKPRNPKDNSGEESTLGPFAKAIGDLDGDKNSDKPAEPSSGGDSDAPEGESEKGEEGETPGDG